MAQSSFRLCCPSFRHLLIGVHSLVCNSWSSDLHVVRFRDFQRRHGLLLGRETISDRGGVKGEDDKIRLWRSIAFWDKPSRGTAGHRRRRRRSGSDEPTCSAPRGRTADPVLQGWQVREVRSRRTRCMARPTAGGNEAVSLELPRSGKIALPSSQGGLELCDEQTPPAFASQLKQPRRREMQQ